MIKWCVKNKTIVLLLSILLLISGGFVYTSLERQENPTITAPIASVRCIYPGASPEDVEKQIIKPLEKKISSIEDVKTIESFSLDSVGIIKVTLKDMSDQDILKNWDKLKDKVDEVKGDLPTQALTPTVDTELTNSFGLVIGLSSKDYTNQDIKRLAKNLEEKINKVKGVAEVKIMGAVDSTIEIQLDMVKLKELKISPTDIATVVKARNINIPGGNLNLTESKIPIQITGEYKGLEEIKNTIAGVSATTGLAVRIRDIANVQMVEKEPDRYSLVGADKAVLLGVRYSNGQNVLKAGREVEKVIDEFKSEELYSKMKLTILTNQPEYVKEAIELFVSNLISAIALVIAVVWLFMGARSALIVSTPIALVTAAILVYMKVMKIPLHQISIAALIISLSLLVANGIVANDNMYLYLQQGRKREEAMILGVKDVNIPILTSTLTTIASFLPLAMMQGSAGKFASALPVLVSVALIASYITSLTVVPAMGDKILQVKSRRGGVLYRVLSVFKIKELSNIFMKGYEVWLRKAISKPKRTIGIFVGLLILSCSLIPLLGMQVFPPIERDQYVLSVSLPNGVTLDNTKKTATEIAQILEEKKAIKSFGAQVGDGFIQYYDTFMSARQGSNVAEFIINGGRKNSEEVAQEIRNKFPSASVTLKFLELSMPQDQPVQVRISGNDISVLKKTAEEVEEKLHDVSGVERTEINYGQDSYKLKVNVDESKANLVGISNYDVATTVRMAINGLEITSLKQKDLKEDSIPVLIRVGKENLRSVSDMEQIFVTSQITNENIPISQISNIKKEASLNQIVRRNENRTITVGVYIKADTSSQKVLENVKTKLADYKTPTGYELTYGGDNEFSEETFGSMVIPAIIAIFLIYLIIALQFGSLLEPLIIMGTIPLSFIGILAGLKIMNYPIGFMAMLGAISLMGVVVNNGIVLLDYIKLLQKSGKTLVESVEEGSKTRLRPIMIGMITTVISLFPLMMSGGPLWQPLAASLNFGMVVSTVLTLIVIPSAYVLVENFRNK